MWFKVGGHDTLISYTPWSTPCKLKLTCAPTLGSTCMYLSAGRPWGTSETRCVACLSAGCLSCVSRGLPGWSCNQQCAQVAPNSAQMTGCVDCLGTPGINTWVSVACWHMPHALSCRPAATHATCYPSKSATQPGVDMLLFHVCCESMLCLCRVARTACSLLAVTTPRPASVSHVCAPVAMAGHAASAPPRPTLHSAIHAWPLRELTPGHVLRPKANLLHYHATDQLSKLSWPYNRAAE